MLFGIDESSASGIKSHQFISSSLKCLVDCSNTILVIYYKFWSVLCHEAVCWSFERFMFTYNFNISNATRIRQLEPTSLAISTENEFEVKTILTQLLSLCVFLLFLTTLKHPLKFCGVSRWGVFDFDWGGGKCLRLWVYINFLFFVHFSIIILCFYVADIFQSKWYAVYDNTINDVKSEICSDCLVQIIIITSFS